MTKNKPQKRVRVISISVVTGVLIIASAILLLVLLGKGKLLLPVSKKETFELGKDAEYAAGLTVKGTKIYNDKGEQIIIKGFRVPELSRLNAEDKFNEKYFEEVFECGGMP